MLLDKLSLPFGGRQSLSARYYLLSLIVSTSNRPVYNRSYCFAKIAVINGSLLFSALIIYFFHHSAPLRGFIFLTFFF